MRHLFTFRVAASLSLVLVGLASCTSKETVRPADEPCATLATVRLCPGRTAVCPTQHTTLELADGTRLRPSGPVWDTYQPRQLNGQRLRISYTLAPQNAYDDPAYAHVKLSCLEENRDWCGTR